MAGDCATGCRSIRNGKRAVSLAAIALALCVLIQSVPASAQDFLTTHGVSRIAALQSHAVWEPRTPEGSGDVGVMHYTDPGKEVHQWIANEAYMYFISQVEGADIGSYLGTIAGSFTADNNDLLEGTVAEDQRLRDPLYQGTPGFLFPDLNPDHPWLRHFCAGADGAELLDGLNGILPSPGDVSAYEQAQNIWTNYAVPAYATNKALAFYRLGHVVHLIEDMTVPAHVHNDEHPISEPYEDWVAANHQFQAWYFGCTRSGDWAYPLSVPASLNDIFYRTANYTEDYDSGDVYGDVARGSAVYYPDDYPSTWHRPAEVSRDGGMSTAELTLTGDDLMPYAMRRVADLYRLWYKEVDTSDPVVGMTYPASEDAQSPTACDSLDAFSLAAAASDPQSGAVKQGFMFYWSYFDGSVWSDWQAVTPSPGTSSISFTPTRGQGLYAFYAGAENGGGRRAQSTVHYMRIALPGCVLNLTPGWNLVSIPFSLADPACSAVFPQPTYTGVWEYNNPGGYAIPAQIVPKKGYWVNASQAATLTLSGARPADRHVSVRAGWNLCGAVGPGAAQTWQPVPTSPACEAVWQYNNPGGYALPARCDEGRGLWLKAGVDTEIWQ